MTRDNDVDHAALVRPREGTAYRRLAALLALAASLTAAGCGPAGSTATVTTTPTVSAAGETMTGTFPTDMASPTASTTATAPAALIVGGNDPNGPACTSLTTAQVEQATGRHVTGIRGMSDHLSTAHRFTCDWKLDPGPDCDCAYVMVTAVWHSNPAQIADLVTYMDRAVASGQQTLVPGLGDHAALLRGGLSSSVAVLQGMVDVNFAVRLSYTDVPKNADVALAVARLAMPNLGLQS